MILDSHLPILSVHLNAFEACGVPAWNDHSIFLGEVANVAQFLFIELFLFYL